MQKLLNKYNEECSIKSNHANIIWKAGVILNSIIYFINAVGLKKGNYIVLYFFIMIILFLISQLVFVIEIGKKLGVSKSSRFFISLQYMRNVYKEIEKFQKQWIVKYCKNNKIYC